MKMTRTKTALVIGTIAFSALAYSAYAVRDQQPDQQQERQEKAKTQPFEGKVKAVDVKAKTLTLTADEKSHDRLIYVTDTTKLTRKGKAIKLGDIMPGEAVHGTTRQTFDGKAEAITVMVGSQEDDKEKSPEQR